MYSLVNQRGKEVFYSESFYETVLEKKRRKNQHLKVVEILSKGAEQARKEMERAKKREKIREALKDAEIKFSLTKPEKKTEDEEGTEITDEELDDFEEALMGKEFRGK